MSLFRTLVVFALLHASHFANAFTVDWEILNRYRAFDYFHPGRPLDSGAMFERYAPSADEADMKKWLERRLSDDPDPRLISPFADASGPWQENAPFPNYAGDFVELPEKIALSLRVVPGPTEQIPSGSICKVLYQGQRVSAGTCSSSLLVEAIPSTGGRLTIESDQGMLADVIIQPTLKIILGLGDSYGAGEGSPDRPTLWKTRSSGTVWPLGIPSDIEAYEWIKKPARWYSNRCNRSYFSAQSILAMKIARDDPHRIVAFVHLSCAGAEVIDGLLAPQRMPPGRPRIAACEDRDLNKHNWQCDVPSSQLDAAVQILCRDNPTAMSGSQVADIKMPLEKIRSGKEQLNWITGFRFCPEGKLRTPDLVFVSVGGNDIGFSGVIAWGLVPNESNHFPVLDVFSRLIISLARDKSNVVCPKLGLKGCRKGVATAEDRMRDLPYRYDALALALKATLNIEGKKVLLPNYPNPLFDEKGALCANPASNIRDVNNQWYATRMLIPSAISPREWQMNLTAGEVASVDKWVIQPLNETVLAAARRHAWVAADLSNVMQGRGWCTGDENELISPDRLTSWHAYRDRTRMIRTSSDSMVTQWPDASRDDWISGTFHPNAWGYAGMATEMVKAAKQMYSPEP